MFSLIGPESADLLEQLGLDTDQLEQPPEQPRRHVLLNFGGKPVIVAAGSGLASPGFTLVSDESVAGELWAALTSKVCSARSPAGLLVSVFVAASHVIWVVMLHSAMRL